MGFYWDFCAISMGFLWNLLGLIGVLWNLVGFLWNLVGFLWGFMRFLWDFMGFLWDFMGFHGILFHVSPMSKIDLKLLIHIMIRASR